MSTESVGEVTGWLVDPLARSVQPATLSIVAGRIVDIRTASPDDCHDSTGPTSDRSPR